MSPPRVDAPYLSAELCVLDSPRDLLVLAGAVVAYFAAKGVKFDRYRALSATGVTSGVATPARLAARLAHPGYNIVTILKNDRRESRQMCLYISPFNPAEQRFQPRPVNLIWATASREFDQDLRALLAALASTYPVAHGMVGAYRSRPYAGHEIDLSLDNVSTIDEATNARLHEDGMQRGILGQRLRRLYPVTIIGPAIWAQLPPMPRFDPMPTVEDFGNCKLLTAWPTLCEPRDPAFLRGTRALREWLWPYTIQNPADHVDNDPVD